MTMEALSDMKAPAFVFDPDQVAHHVVRLIAHDSTQTETDRQARQHYSADHPQMLWIDRQGIGDKADSLLAWLEKAGQHGLSGKAFRTDDIRSDLQRLRTLDFDHDANSINRVAARLEYNLTRSMMRYARGMRYGFVNPSQLFNHLDAEKLDTAGRVLVYRGLYDTETERPAKDYFQQTARKVMNDSVAPLLADIQPSTPFYRKLQDMLAKAQGTQERMRIVCNMERERWRRHEPMAEKGKRVVVNVPAYHLYAYSDTGIVDMKVVCGAQKTKTPLLDSHIEWMEVNPQWIIPRSIIEKDVVRHAGDSSYFARNRYNIVDKATNKTVPARHVSRQMLVSGKYRVAQESGSHNSLGRIVFRFKNKHSVFLHYTSNPGAFSRESRAISHGCVRVERPFDLARYMLDEPDDWTLDKIRISMGMQPETEQGILYMRDFLARRKNENEEPKLIGYVPVKPRVPIYIIYQTIWPDQHGTMRTWPDVYGYDQQLAKALKPYL
jgi:murein L,D-transpeptidase YcbB/YkuD